MRELQTEPLTHSLRSMPVAERSGFLATSQGLAYEALESDLTFVQRLQPNLSLAEHLIENPIGYASIPLGVAEHFVIDGEPVWIPMAVEETSIVAAASATAKWIKKCGSIRTFLKGTSVIGQIQFPKVQNPEALSRVLYARQAEILTLANTVVPGLVRRGGGFSDLKVRELVREDSASMVILDLFCDPCDAMGANLLNQACEFLKVPLQTWTNERIGMCILSNLTDTKLACAEIVVDGVSPEFGRNIEDAMQFARLDPYRAATHNKGVMNGIDAVLIATGNDWRAVEAGAHAFAARSGKYQPLTSWKFEDGRLHGSIEVPMSVGTVGGATRLMPAARFALALLNTTSSARLARICAAVGLVQNLGALRALCTEGIVKGHMQLHAKNLALAAGAEPEESEAVVASLLQKLETCGFISEQDAHDLLLRRRD